MKNEPDYFRIKMEWSQEKNDGCLKKVKTEELVAASSYTEAEKVAYALIEDEGRDRFVSPVSIEIIKTKISEILYSTALTCDNKLIAGLTSNYFEMAGDTEKGLYAVKVAYIDLDEKTGEEKHTNGVIYVPALSNIDAFKMAEKFLKERGLYDFIIRDVKFDKAESILWPPEVHKNKLELAALFA
jgi:hypothetical protein